MQILTDCELGNLLREGESDRVEFKRNANDLERIRQAVCAFANDLANHQAPGVVFVGVDDNGNCADLDINDDLLKRLAQIRDDGSLTTFPSMDVRKAVISDCKIVVIVVQPSENPPVRFNGRTWIGITTHFCDFDPIRGQKGNICACRKTVLFRHPIWQCDFALDSG